MNDDKETTCQLMTPGLMGALSRVQAEIRNPALNRTNPHFRNKYADLPSTLAMVRPILAKHGLALTQMPGVRRHVLEATSYEVYITTAILHEESGGVLLATTSSWHNSPPKIQAEGGDFTYLRRYSISALLAISGDDDLDGNAIQAPDSDVVTSPEGTVLATVKKPKKRKTKKTSSHDPSWATARKLTAVLLRECGWNIESASKFAEDHGMARLSAMTNQQRDNFIERLRNPERPEVIEQWLNRNQPGGES